MVKRRLRSKKGITVQDKESVVQNKVAFYPNPATNY